MEDKRYARQIALFGKEGQLAIRNTKVAIVGCGGLGSHVAQQLAYLGVQDFTLIDKELLEDTNLNRWVGAVDGDVNMPKVCIMQRLILAISPKSKVIPIQESVIHKDSLEALKEADVLFGCVDDDAIRLFLTHVASVLGLPYVDLSSEVLEKGIEYGGRVMFSLNGESCLSCMDELDQEEVRRGFSSEEDKEVDKQLYGVRRDVLQGSGPSVVSLNGTIASLAVTEFFVWRTGLRSPKRLFKYYGSKVEIRHSRDLPGKDCYYCKGIYGSMDVEEIRGRFLS